MELLSNIPHYLISLLVLLTVVVFVHELGHFWVARRCGVRVEVFSVGFGSELFGFTDRHGTRWKFSAIPLGGYVKMFGQADKILEPDGQEREMTAAEKAESFHHKPLWQRAAVVFAGPAANYVLAIVAFAILFASVGQLVATYSVIGTVQKGSAAEEAGIQVGDRIVSVNGQPIKYFEELVTQVHNSAGNPMRLRIQRGSESIELTAQPRETGAAPTDPPESRVYRLGVGPSGDGEYKSVGIWDACVSAVVKSYEMTALILSAIWEMITGTRSSQELGGILRIGKVAGDVAKQSLVDYLFLVPYLSLNLGLINLFPIPLLDGGHLTFYAIESVRGRPLSERAQEWGLRIGVVVVLGLFVFATWNDLIELKVVDFIKNLVT